MQRIISSRSSRYKPVYAETSSGRKMENTTRDDESGESSERDRKRKKGRRREREEREGEKSKREEEREGESERA